MQAIKACQLPQDAFLQRLREDGNYVDCYCARVAGRVEQSEFVSSFYTTWLFKLERLILRWAVGRPSNDQEARELGLGQRERFAAWHVEARSESQLLLCDFSGRTRSWLMAMVDHGATSPSTMLHFGSAVVARLDPGTGRRSMGASFRLLLGFHKLYSRLLLHAACRSLQRRRATDGAPPVA